MSGRVPLRVEAGKEDGVAREVKRLTDLPLPQLRSEWHRWHPERQMPARLSRDLLGLGPINRIHIGPEL